MIGWSLRGEKCYEISTFQKDSPIAAFGAMSSAKNKAKAKKCTTLLAQRVLVKLVTFYPRFGDGDLVKKRKGEWKS